MEYTKRLTENLVTAPTAPTFLPNDPIVFEQPLTNPQVLGKIDTNLSSTNTLAVRYRRDSDRLDRHGYRRQRHPRARTGSRSDAIRIVAVHDNWIVGSRGVNEFRMQVARRYFNWDVSNYCPKCPTVNRPGLNLGKASNMPQGRTEDRIQLANTFNWLVPDKAGSHSLKAGVDASFIDLFSEFHNNLDGTFTFTTSAPFDPAVASTYPTQYTKNTGDPIVNLNNNIYAAFVQDQWRPADRLTINLGVRWDYEDVVGIDHDKNNFAPRFGVVWDVNGSGRTVLRANAGIYYDQIFLNIPLNAENAKKFVQTLISNPGYPDPNGPNPEPDRRTDHADSQLDAVCAGQPDAVHRADHGRRAASDWPHVLDFSRPGPRPRLRPAAIERRQLPEPGRSGARATRIRRSSASRSSRRRATPGTRDCRSASRSGCRIATPTPWRTRCRRPSAIRRTSTSSRWTIGSTSRNADRRRTMRGIASRRRSPAVAVADPGRHVDRGTVEAALQHHDRRRRQPRHANQRSARRRRPQLRPRRLALPGRSPCDQVDADARRVGVELIGEAFNITNQKNWTNFTGQPARRHVRQAVGWRDHPAGATGRARRFLTGRRAGSYRSRLGKGRLRAPPAESEVERRQQEQVRAWSHKAVEDDHRHRMLDLVAGRRR